MTMLRIFQGALCVAVLAAGVTLSAQTFAPSQVDRERAPLYDWKTASAANGGTALSTTVTRIVIPMGTAHVRIRPRNFATGVVAKLIGLPYVAVISTSDALASVATDYSSEAQDGNGANHVTLSDLDTLANGDYLLIGCMQKFAGLFANVDAVNSNASVLAAHYWNGTAWTDLSPTDNTASGGATFAQDGTVTWTAPAAWVKRSLRAIGQVTGDVPVAATPRMQDEALFWARVSVSAALDSAVTLDELLSRHQSTAYFEVQVNQLINYWVSKGLGGISGYEALMNAGTGNVVVTVGAGPNGFEE